MHFGKWSRENGLGKMSRKNGMNLRRVRLSAQEDYQDKSSIEPSSNEKISKNMGDLLPILKRNLFT